jgi:alpha-L-fucosidase 2
LSGWTSHHNIDLWRATIPASGLASWAYWPMCGAWLCQHLWQHYAYGGDRAFLRDTVYPLTMGAAEFLLGFLVEDPEGYLSTAPSTSPENNFFVRQLAEVEEGQRLQISAGNRMGQYKQTTSSVCKSSTMDLTLIREVFEHCLEAAEILGQRSAFHDQLEDALDRLYPFQIGKHGQLQEWNEDFDECAPGMGHVSHMVGLYPGSLFTPDRNPELYEACRQSMFRRLTHGSHRGGWPASWAICLLARLHEHALCELITTTVYNRLGANMLTGRTYQIDCIYGLGAAVAELLLQSHNGAIELLPCLPPSWTSGRYAGFRAVGGFEVSAEWENQQLTRATVTSHGGQTCRIVANGLTRVTSAGTSVSDVRMGSDWIEFETEPGRSYELAREEAQ